jgi:hypothetical protein
MFKSGEPRSAALRSIERGDLWVERLLAAL